MGRAIVYARDHDVRPFRDIILDACLHCRALDPQIEGTRADYMLDLVKVLPDRNFYMEEVLRAIPGCGDDWHGCQRYRFAACMAFEGDEFAKKIMYESFPPGPQTAAGIAIYFAQMDGVQGFTFAASKIGALLNSGAKVIDADWLWSYVVENFGEQEAQAALQAASATNSNVERYRLSLRQDQTTESRNNWQEFRALSYEQLKPQLARASRVRVPGWGKHASQADLEQAARGLLQEQSVEGQVQHLRIFSRRAFPLDPSKLLELAVSSDVELARSAGRALGHVVNASVRDLAFQLIESRATSGEFAIAMLDRNFQPGDHEIVLGWFENETDRDARHRMEMDLKEFCSHHPDSVAEPPVLLSLYENGPCSFCREYVVQRFIELDALSPELQRECEFDANKDIRQLVAKAETKS